MDSHVSLASFTCRDTLIMILRKLGARDLARASCVCRLWRDMASDDAIVRPAFMEPWKLKEIVGEPVSGSFWRENGIWKFAISHKIAREDSVTSLAKKYSVQVRDIKLLNNMTSDNDIYSRERLLIPIINPNSLINGICYIELDTYTKREVLVLYPGGQPDKKLM
uniref:LysM domain-containing protein n=1 Tax=Populus trichocarpa TaxID=3694 RepID=A0A2K1R8J2_POPTR